MAWNGGELSYLVQLLESRGNKDVPRDFIVRYLRTQAHSAMRDGEMSIFYAIRAAAGLWTKEQYGTAVRVVREAWAKEQNL